MPKILYPVGSHEATNGPDSTQIQVIFVKVIRSDLVINTIVVSELRLVETECRKPNGFSICDAGVVIVSAPAVVLV